MYNNKVKNICVMNNDRELEWCLLKLYWAARWRRLGTFYNYK